MVTGTGRVGDAAVLRAAAEAEEDDDGEVNVLDAVVAEEEENEVEEVLTEEDEEAEEEDEEEVLDDAETGGEGGGNISGLVNNAPCSDATLHSLANNLAVASSGLNLSVGKGGTGIVVTGVGITDEEEAKDSKDWPAPSRRTSPSLVTVSTTGTGAEASSRVLLPVEADAYTSALP